MAMIMKQTCVNIACGSSYIDGWLNLDYSAVSPAVTKANLLGRLPLSDVSTEVVYSSHFLEHIPRKKVEGFLSECFRVMKPGGQIRLVLPDLEELCREYLRQRDANEHAKADFIVLEMLDQCVRTEPGGELGEFYGNLRKGGVSDLMRYVVARTGEEFTETQAGGQRFSMARLSGWLERIYCRSISRLFPSAFLDQNVSFSSVGERHAWIYDFHSLSDLLEKAGFVSIRKMSFDKSDIQNFPFFPLDATQEGLPRKGKESMYVEAMKP